MLLQITSDLTTCGLSEDVSALVISCVDARRAGVRQFLQNSASVISSNSLTDFDWSLRVRSGWGVSLVFTPALVVNIWLGG
jgi:hypothetical protein